MKTKNMYSVVLVLLVLLVAILGVFYYLNNYNNSECPSNIPLRLLNIETENSSITFKYLWFADNLNNLSIIRSEYEPISSNKYTYATNGVELPSNTILYLNDTILFKHSLHNLEKIPDTGGKHSITITSVSARCSKKEYAVGYFLPNTNTEDYQ